MSHPLDSESSRRRDRDERKRLADQEEIFRKDFQQLLSTPGARRVLYRFIAEMGLDTSPFNTNAMAQSRSIGLQDAAKWWINAIREHCPEREAMLRIEGKTNALLQRTDEVDENEH